jgi:hypothetical protein
MPPIFGIVVIFDIFSGDISPRGRRASQLLAFRNPEKGFKTEATGTGLCGLNPTAHR